MKVSTILDKLLQLLFLWQSVLADSYNNITGIVSGDIVHFKLDPSKIGIERRWPNIAQYRMHNLELEPDNGFRSIYQMPDSGLVVNFMKNPFDSDAVAIWTGKDRKLSIYRTNNTNDCTFSCETQYQLTETALIRFVQFVKRADDLQFISYNAYFLDKSVDTKMPRMMYYEKSQAQPTESILNEKLDLNQLEKLTFWTISSGNSLSLIAPLDLLPDRYSGTNHLLLLEVGWDSQTSRTTEIIHDLAAALAEKSISINGFQYAFATIIETSMRNAAPVGFVYNSIIFGGRDYSTSKKIVLFNCILRQSGPTQCMEFFSYQSSTGTPEILLVDGGEPNTTAKLVPSRVLLRIPDSETSTGTFKTLQFIVNYTLSITSPPGEKDTSKMPQKSTTLADGVQECLV